MTDLNEMWTRLGEHQPIADARGYGEAWKIMCEQRTPEAAEAAAQAACAAKYVEDGAVAAAWSVAEVVEADAGCAPTRAAVWSRMAIYFINKAEASDEQN